MLRQVADDVVNVLPAVSEHFVAAFVGSLVPNTGRKVAIIKLNLSGCDPNERLPVHVVCNKLLIDGVDSCRLHNHVFKNHDE
jgi:hypothetical protein